MRVVAFSLLLLWQSVGLAWGELSGCGIIARKPGAVFEDTQLPNQTSLAVLVRNDGRDPISIPTCGYFATVSTEGARSKIRLSLVSGGDGATAGDERLQLIRLGADQEVYFVVRIFDRLRRGGLIEINFTFTDSECARFGLPANGVRFTIDDDDDSIFVSRRKLGIAEGREITAPKCLEGGQ